MEWFVVAVFVIFISGLMWVSAEAIAHGRKSKASEKKNPTDSTLGG